MAARAAVVLALLVLEDPDLRPAPGLDHRGRDLGAGEEGSAQPGRFVVASDEEDLAKGDRSPTGVTRLST